MGVRVRVAQVATRLDGDLELCPNAPERASGRRVNSRSMAAENRQPQEHANDKEGEDH